MIDKNKVNEQEPKPNKYKWFRRIILACFALFMLFTVSLIIIATNYNFRHWAIEKILDIVNGELIAKIEIGDINFLSLHGIKITDARLITGGDTLAYVPELTVDIAYEELLNNNLKVTSVILERPNIQLIRDMRGIWNTSKIAAPKPKEPDTTKSEMVFDLKRIIIKNGSFTMKDSTQKPMPYGKFFYADMRFRSLNLDITGKLKPGDNSYVANIHNISFYDAQSGIALNSLKMDAELNDKHIKADNAELITQKGKIKFNALMDKFNVFGGGDGTDITKTIFDFDAEVEDFDPSLVYAFAPIPIKLGGIHNAKIKAKGPLNHLDITRLDILTGETDLSMTCRLDNTLMGNIKYKAEINDSKLRYTDLKEILKSIDFTNIPDFGTANIKSLKVLGSTDSVSADMAVETGLGGAKGSMGIGFAAANPAYFANIEAYRLDLGKVLKNPNMSSSITGKIEARGAGFDPNKLNATLKTKLENSTFTKYDITKLNLDMAYHGGQTIQIDTLDLYLPNKHFDATSQMYGDQTGKLSLHGTADISNWNSPGYKLDVKFKALDLESLVENASMPRYCSGNLQVDAKGFNLDTLTGRINAHIDDLLFSDKVLMPFDLNLNISKNSAMQRNVELRSDFVDADLFGEYLLSDLLSSLIDQGLFIGGFVTQKLNTMKPEITNKELKKVIEFPKTGHFKDIDCQFTANIKSLAPITVFVPDMYIDASSYLSFSFRSSGSESYFDIDSARINSFNLDMKGFNLRTDPVNFSGLMNINLKDSVPNFSSLLLKVISENNLTINGARINNPGANMKFDGNVLNFKAEGGFNEMLTARLNGLIDISSPTVLFKIDSSTISYLNRFTWETTYPISATVGSQGLTIESFRLGRLGSERISLVGNYNKNVARGIELKLYDFSLTDLSLLLPIQDKKQLPAIKGMLDSVVVKIDGDIKTPVIDVKMHTKDFKLNEIYIGNVSADLTHKNANIRGNMQISNPNLPKLPKLLDIDIASFPLNLGIDSIPNRFSETEPVDLTLKAKDLPLPIVAPFIPNVTDLSGNANAELKVSGFAPNKITYTGNLNFRDIGFVLTNTNVGYRATGNVNIETDLITIEKVKVKNLQRDLSDGAADVWGTVKLKEFMPEDIDINLKTKRLLVLKDESQASLPFLYGTCIIATEARPLKFSGTLKEPNLEGDVIVLNADLKMPQQTGKQVTRTSFYYEVRGKSKKYFIKTQADTTATLARSNQINGKKIESGANFADLINYDLNVRIKRFTILIDMGALGEVFAKIGTKDMSTPIHYIKTRNNPNATLYGGELLLKEGSTIKVFRIMDAQGSISFPTGRLDNPVLDLLATYNGKFLEGSTTTNYSVKVYVTGSVATPNIRLTYSLNGEEATGDAKKIEEDAFLLLTTGRTKSSLGTASGTSNLGGEALNMGISQIASKSLTDLLLGTGMIQSADIKFQGERFENAQVNLSGSFFGIGNWTIGGTVADLSSNNEITLDVPISVQSSGFLNNFILQLSKTTNLNVSTQLQDAKDFEIKIKFGGSW